MRRLPNLILVSACLIGEDCRYDGKNCLQKDLSLLLEGQEIVAICPEMEGGLATPRPPAEIKNGTGSDVLRDKAFVKNVAGDDLTVNFIKGAKKILEGLVLEQIDFAILKSRSPSCGIYQIYNGEFNGHLRAGPGVTAAFLKSKGITLYTEEELDKIKNRLRK